MLKQTLLIVMVAIAVVAITNTPEAEASHKYMCHNGNELIYIHGAEQAIHLAHGDEYAEWINGVWTCEPVPPLVVNFVPEGIICDFYYDTATTFSGLYPGGVHCVDAAATVLGTLITSSSATFYINGALDTEVGSSVEDTDMEFIVYGAFSTGANSEFYGDVTADGAINTGADSYVEGDLTADGAVNTGADSSVEGDLTSNNEAVNTGANSEVEGDIEGFTVINTGADSYIEGCLTSPIQNYGLASTLVCDGVPFDQTSTDFDQDLVSNELDLCTNTREGAAVNEDGCSDDQLADIAYYAQKAIDDAAKKKSSSDNAALQRWLERPSFGMNYKTFQPFEESGVTINGQLNKQTQQDNMWRMFVGEPALGMIHSMDIVVQSEHGIRYIMFTPNKVSEGQHNNEERFDVIVRDSGKYGVDGSKNVRTGDFTFVEPGENNTNATITVDREGEFVTINVAGLFNQSGVMQIEIYDNNNERQMLFIHFE
jgi:cytoskeletal protein CcmA (bactofilin family)